MILKTFTTEQSWIKATLTEIQNSLTPYSLLLMPTVALSGGSTPRPIYQAMQSLPETKSIHFYQVDERYVPKDNEKSNYKLITESLKPKHFHYFDTSLTIHEALSKYQSKLPDQLDVILLGLGPDGHTASLFPHSPALTETNPLTHTTTDEFDIKDRLTLTFPSIMNAKKIIILLKGENKQQILDDLLHSDKSVDDLPAKKLLEHHNLVIHYLK